jgi:4-hydroxybenzoate polyprenyltransferase
MFAFACASAAVYFVNDVVDADRDRRHPVKRNRPVMRWYQPGMLRIVQLLIGVGMLATYLMWAASETTDARPWHLASALPLAAALVRFGVLTARRTVRPVEDLITRDALMLCFEAAWLVLFCVGLYAA